MTSSRFNTDESSCSTWAILRWCFFLLLPACRFNCCGTTHSDCHTVADALLSVSIICLTGEDRQGARTNGPRPMVQRTRRRFLFVKKAKVNDDTAAAAAADQSLHYFDHNLTFACQYRIRIYTSRFKCRHHRPSVSQYASRRTNCQARLILSLQLSIRWQTLFIVVVVVLDTAVVQIDERILRF